MGLSLGRFFSTDVDNCCSQYFFLQLFLPAKNIFIPTSKKGKALIDSFIIWNFNDIFHRCTSQSLLYLLAASFILVHK